MLELLDADIGVVVIRRHQAVPYFYLDEGRIQADVLVGHELHGSTSTGAVADRAVVLDDGGHVRRVGDVGVVLRRREGCLSVCFTL